MTDTLTGLTAASELTRARLFPGQFQYPLRAASVHACVRACWGEGGMGAKPANKTTGRTVEEKKAPKCCVWTEGMKTNWVG